MFTPGAPVNEKDLFSGRIEQIGKVLSAISQRGYHGVLYGERGVGKTSLSNILHSMLPSREGWVIARVNCDGDDTFSSLWRKAFSDVTVTTDHQSLGFISGTIKATQTIADGLPADLSPDLVRRQLGALAQQANTLFIFDEFDRILNQQVARLMADTIKALSDFSVNSTILLIGVADSVDDIVAGHQSIERALVQIPMPRMSPEEIGKIIKTGFDRLGMAIDPAASKEILNLSQGLPYIAHLLALHSGKSALIKGRKDVTHADVEAGITISLEDWQQSTKKAYSDATQSAQPGNLYKAVLLACALSETDDLGFFTASSVRYPLRAITGRDYDIPNFAQHLKNFSEASRGSILFRTGQARRIRYRFSGPLLRPYIVMSGLKDGLLKRKVLASLTS